MRAITSLILLLALGAAQASALRCPMDSGPLSRGTGSDDGLPAHHSAPDHEHGGEGSEGGRPDSSGHPVPTDVDCALQMSCGVAAAPAVVLATFEAGELLAESRARASSSLESIFLDIRIPPPRT